MALISLSVLFVELLLPTVLQRHLETNHPDHKSKEVGFFRAKLNNLNSQKLLLSHSLGRGLEFYLINLNFINLSIFYKLKIRH